MPITYKAYKEHDGTIVIVEEGTEADIDRAAESENIEVPGLGQETTDDGNTNLNNGGSLAPYLSGVVPQILSTSTTLSIQVTGDNFDPSTVFELEATSGATIQNVIIVSPNVATMDITTGSADGTFSLTATNSGIESFGQISVVQQSVTVITPGDPVTPWENVSGAITTGPGSITGAASPSGWNKQATFGSIPANTDGFLEFTYAGPTTNAYGMVGLTTDPTANTSYNTIDYAVYVANGSAQYVFENGSNKGYFGAIVAPTIFKIERIGNTITYYKDGVLFYTSLNQTTQELFFDSSIYRNSQFTNIRIEY